MKHSWDPDKRCLVLIGETGVGKSHFIMERATVLHDNPHQCALLYDGQLVGTDRPLSQMMTEDFDRIQKFTKDGYYKIDDILRDINNTVGMQWRQVVLFIDGINENTDAKVLLGKIDELVRQAGDILTWLKVVITCRPETWRTIQSKLKLASHVYYRLKGQEEIGIELDRFNLQEARVAYDLHKTEFNLRTQWDAISPDMRQILQHPLYMWLVASTHEGQALPREIRRSRVFEDYVEALCEAKKLERHDLSFLRDDLMPLMINDNQLAKAVRDSALNKTQAELINNDVMLNTGRRVNQSFLNLSNVRILKKQELARTYEIGFQYEGFYEYFGGARLYELHKGKEAVALTDAYRATIQQLGEQPYLWGVIKYALLLELENGHTHLVVALSQTEKEVEKDLIAATLREYGREQPQAVAGIVKQMLALRDGPRQGRQD